MKLYKNVIALSKETITVASLITKLGKVKAVTEDKELIKCLFNVITELQKYHVISINKSTPICLMHSTDASIINLIQYCQQLIGNQKPEWQVIAERNNWGPKI
ncbi:hypothetical protein L5M43_14445 [Shewanella sp. SW36]|uniref:hypothetical protein n=1 Tax=unclassified Shewanella TaxID=196818 RepID=UPI0021D8E039|nr:MULTISPECIES: hypothetical protein [unclassified Shewanella]MCU7976438.1 hypothetical protein [Shewanella sp. SW36]MCU7991678.1 hypothetical protein [Shewanella sp. SW1]MCU8053058.1 hypothetical protein [Shewanella sp. SM43]